MEDLNINQLWKTKLILEQRLENFKRRNFNQEGNYTDKITNLDKRLEKVISQIKERCEKTGYFYLLELDGINEYKDLKFYHVEYDTEKLYDKVKFNDHTEYPYGIIGGLSELAHFIFRDKLWYISNSGEGLLFRRDKISKNELIEGLNKINEYLKNYYFNYHFVNGEYRR